MKHTITALIISALVSFAPTAYAEDDCASVSKLAEKVMEARQAGVPMASLMEIDEPGTLTHLAIVEAYKEHRYTAPRVVRQVIVEFGNDFYMACHRYRDGAGE